MDIQIFVQNVKHILDERGISYSRAGRESGAGIDFIRNMERKGSWPSAEKILQMAAYLGMTAGELLGEEKGPTPVTEGEPIYPPEYDLLSPEDKALIDNMIRSLSKKGPSSAAPPSPPESEDEAIDREVEEFRRRLILEKNQEAGSSLSNGAGSETA